MVQTCLNCTQGLSYSCISMYPTGSTSIQSAYIGGNGSIFHIHSIKLLRMNSLSTENTLIYTDIHPKKIVLSNKCTFDLSLNTITLGTTEISLQYPLNTNDYELNKIYIEKMECDSIFSGYTYDELTNIHSINNKVPLLFRCSYLFNFSKINGVTTVNNHGSISYMKMTADTSIDNIYNIIDKNDITPIYTNNLTYHKLTYDYRCSSKKTNRLTLSKTEISADTEGITFKKIEDDSLANVHVMFDQGCTFIDTIDTNELHTDKIEMIDKYTSIQGVVVDIINDRLCIHNPISKSYIEFDDNNILFHGNMSIDPIYIDDFGPSNNIYIDSGIATIKNLIYNRQNY